MTGLHRRMLDAVVDLWLLWHLPDISQNNDVISTTFGANVLCISTRRLKRCCRACCIRTVARNSRTSCWCRNTSASADDDVHADSDVDNVSRLIHPRNCSVCLHEVINQNNSCRAPSCRQHAFPASASSPAARSLECWYFAFLPRSAPTDVRVDRENTARRQEAWENIH